MFQPVHYSLTSYWSLAADAASVSEVITDLPRWTQWWPGLESLRLIKNTPEHIGSSAELTFKARGGYRLAFTMKVTEYEPAEVIEFTASGDLKGSGTCRFERQTNGDAHLSITWEVATTKPWMNLFEPILRPIFIKNHEKLMDRGEKGLNNYLKRNI